MVWLIQHEIRLVPLFQWSPVKMDLKIIGVTLWTIFHLLTGVFAARKGNGLLSAGCHAWCLWKHRDYLLDRIGGDPQDKKMPLMEDCLQSPMCLTCLKPCSILPENIPDCSDQCLESEKQCQQACLYLNEKYSNKTGSCPDPMKASNFEAVCADVCDRDGDCEEDRKCCSNGCGHTCQKPIKVPDSIPAIPTNITLAEKGSGRAVRVRWSVPDNPYSSAPVVYVIEMRKMSKIKPKWGTDTPWRLAVQTEPVHAMIRGIWAGHWYQFRVAAVNSDGYREFSVPSQVFKSSRAVGRPSRPENFTEGETTLRKNKVDVTLNWMPPKRSDLPVWKYKVYYSERLARASPVIIRIDVLKATVPGDQTQVVLKDLSPGTTYFLQVEAIVKFGKNRLKGEKASLYITTYTPPDFVQDPPFGTPPPYHPEMIEVWNLTAGDSYFHNSSLKAQLSWKIHTALESSVQRFLVYWSPDVCDQKYEASMLTVQTATTLKQTFILYDLLYECDYIVKVMAVNSDGVQGKPSSFVFYTPMCSQTFVKGRLPPVCPSRLPRPPKKPPSLFCSVETEECNVTIKIRWKHPYSDMPLDGYAVTWGEAESSRDVTYKRESVVYKTHPVEQYVLNNTVQYSLHDVLDSSYYVIKIRAMSKAGRGKPAIRGVFTPVLQSCPETISGTQHELKTKPVNSIQVGVLKSTTVSSSGQISQQTYTYSITRQVALTLILSLYVSLIPDIL